ncbi:jg24918 [Pararge aegeria aegeria]|uniref:Jg24918 protein n=1 Tax=Pararge aegeria aegeria TaxID=348720 RepID=A0A8S4QCV7_9NEOP|nr:jg24918 [Pararge aegeria aegeria]
MEAEQNVFGPQEGPGNARESLPRDAALAPSCVGAATLGCPSYSGGGGEGALQRLAPRRRKALTREQQTGGNTPTGAGPSKRGREVSDDAIDPSGDSKRTKILTSYKQELTGTKMAIVTDDFPRALIGQEMVREIQGILVGMLRATNV